MSYPGFVNAKQYKGAAFFLPDRASRTSLTFIAILSFLAFDLTICKGFLKKMDTKITKNGLFAYVRLPVV
jgi:hypothetical protein